MRRATIEVRTLRRARGWTQSELAERLGVDAITVSRWERGLSRPRRAAHEAMAGLEASAQAGELVAKQSSSVASRFASEHAAVDELVRIVGIDAALAALRRLVLLRRAPAMVRFPVDPATRLREVESALREQSELISRARIG